MPITALRRRVATDPGRPLFTHYDGAAGSRIELSGVTVANWVDKTVNFMDTLGVEPHSVVRLELARTHPGHWVTAVWTLAAWQWGCTLSLGTDARAELMVGGPDVTAEKGAATVACSLHPLGLPLRSVPDGCTDYSEVFGEPDVGQVADVDPAAIAWTPRVSFADLAQVPPSSERALFVDPDSGFDTVAALLVAPLLGGGSSVVVTDAAHELADRVRRDERISG